MRQELRSTHDYFHATVRISTSLGNLLQLVRHHTCSRCALPTLASPHPRTLSAAVRLMCMAIACAWEVSCVQTTHFSRLVTHPLSKLPKPDELQLVTKKLTGDVERINMIYGKTPSHYSCLCVCARGCCSRTTAPCMLWTCFWSPCPITSRQAIASGLRLLAPTKEIFRLLNMPPHVGRCTGVRNFRLLWHYQ